jgi:hypothetical protein
MGPCVTLVTGMLLKVTQVTKVPQLPAMEKDNKNQGASISYS